MESLQHQYHIVKTPCYMCIMHCGLDVHVQDGKIIKIEGMAEHPINKGRRCIKSNQIIDHVYSEDRLKYPMIKSRRGFERISWDDALDTIADRLQQSRENHGPDSLLLCVGDPVLIQWHLGHGMAYRFGDLFETPCRILPGTLCYSPKMWSRLISFGKWLIENPENSNCIIVWGANPHHSFPMLAHKIESARKKGAKLGVIDPRRTPLAKKADLHIQVRPGTAAALALAMIHTIISEKLYDRDVVENWTFGFAELTDHVKEYNPETVEGITGVPAGQIKAMARLYATNKPASIIPGINSLDQNASGFDASRALDILQGITGNIDIPGGWVMPRLGFHLKSARLSSMKLMGTDKYPLAHQIGPIVTGGGGQRIDWADIVLTGKPHPIKTMIVSGSNPLITWPNSNHVKQAMEKLDFLVVMDQLTTATTEMADLVLPACTFMEREAFAEYSIGHGIPTIMFYRPVIQPLWESRPDWKFWVDLGKRMGYEAYFPWNNAREIMDYFLERTGLTVEQIFRDHPDGVVSGKMISDQPYLRKGFRTPSGKIELYPNTLEKAGFPPLPVYRPNPESPMGNPELAREYPLILTTGARELEYWHSQYHDLPGLRRIKPEPFAQIHPQTAAGYEIRNQDWMIVETKRGGIRIKAEITEDILPGVVGIPHGWSRANVNILTDDSPCDPVTGYPALKGLLCRIRKDTEAVRRQTI